MFQSEMVNFSVKQCTTKKLFSLISIVSEQPEMLCYKFHNVCNKIISNRENKISPTVGERGFYKNNQK